MVSLKLPLNLTILCWIIEWYNLLMIKLSSFLSFSFPERIGMICILWYALYKNGSLLLLLFINKTYYRKGLFSFFTKAIVWQGFIKTYGKNNSTVNT